MKNSHHDEEGFWIDRQKTFNKGYVLDYTYMDIQKDIDKYRTLNNRIEKIQDNIIKEAIKLDKELKNRVTDKNHSLGDYEIEIQVTFHLKEDDKSYDENKDNILARFYENVKHISLEEKRDSNRLKYKWGKYNHNEYRCRGSHPMKDDYHCWWLHCLYDHTELEFQDLLRIGLIWTDIKVWHQYFDER